MKKSVLSIALFSVVSGSAMAATPTFDMMSKQDIENAIAEARMNPNMKVVETENGVNIRGNDGSNYVQINNNGGDDAEVFIFENGKGERYDVQTSADGKINKITDSKGNDHTNAAVKEVEVNGGLTPDDNASRNTARLDDIEKSGLDMVKALDAQYNAINERLDKIDQRMDGVMAGTHAINNARPFVQNGQTAFGVGTGFAGSAQAVAVGFAHSFEDSAWSMSATTNISTGSKIKTEASFGAGVQYAF